MKSRFALRLNLEGPSNHSERYRGVANARSRANERKEESRYNSHTCVRASRGPPRARCLLALALARSATAKACAVAVHSPRGVLMLPEPASC